MIIKHKRRLSGLAKPAAFVLAAVLTAVGLVQLVASPVQAENGAIWPTDGYVRGLVGEDRGDHIHEGIDIANSAATVPVYATQDGTAYHREDPGGYGTYIIMAHANGYKSLYGHLNSRSAGNGQFVRQGELIGYMGNTGRSNGKHLHFEIRNNASYSGNFDGAPINFNGAAGNYNNYINARSVINHNFPNLVSTTQETQVANVNSCGALYIKRTYWGNWENHMGCGQAKSVAMSPDGNLIAVVRPDNTLVAKETYWGNWVQHTGIGDTQDVAVGNNGFIANVNGCGALYIKRSWWGNWDQHMGCGQAKGVSMSGNGETILVTRPDNTLVGKSSYWGNWIAHTGVGDSQDSAVSSNGTIANVNGCGALYVKQSYWGNWVQHTGCGQVKAVAVSPNGEGFATVRPDNTLIAKQSYWGDWAQHVGVGDSKASALSNR